MSGTTESVTPLTTYTYDEALQHCLEYFGGEELPARVFLDKYALRNEQNELVEKTPDDMHWRIARELARVEKGKFKKPMSEEEIFGYIQYFRKIIPQGSPMFGIGNPYQTASLSNCFTIDSPVDSYGGIMHTDQQLVQIAKRRGGIGLDISHLRPAEAPTANAARTSTGIISFMERYSNSTREVGQCIAKGERVLTDSGLKAIEEVEPFKDKVWTEKGWVNVTNLHRNGIKPIYQLATQCGYKLKTSVEHQFQTVENGEVIIRRLGEFEIGDPIVLIPGKPVNRECVELTVEAYQPKAKSWAVREQLPLPTKLDDNLAYVIGFAYGNGCVTIDKFNEPCELSLSVSHNYPEVEQKLVTLIKELFCYTPAVIAGDGKVNIIKICNKSILHYLANNQILKQKTLNLIFPNLILQSPTSVQFSFLAGYLDADGNSSCVKKSGYRFDSICKEFLEYCQVLLMANGIPAKLHQEIPKEENWNVKYRLVIVGAFAQRRFLEKMVESFKVQQARHIAKRDCLLTPYRAKNRKLSYNKYAYLPSDTYISANCFYRLQEDNVLDKDEQILIQDLVESVELVGESETYDLTLEEVNWYFCEGVYTKNSGRRGALMVTCSVHHPQIIDFIKCKADLTKITGANISVRLTNEFLKAVENNIEYELRWPVDVPNPKISKKISARKVWDLIIYHAWLSAEPGVLFWDTILQESPADCYAHLGFKTIAPNPCAELLLSALDSCRLLLLNLYAYVRNHYTNNAFFDFKAFYQDAQVAQRLMDDIVDLELECIDKIINKIKRDPEPKHIKQAELEMWKRIKENCVNGRRTGTGITALGDALAAIGIKFGTDESVLVTEQIYCTLKLGCYRSSVDMAKEIGAFPIWNAELEINNPFLLRIKEDDPELYADMQKHGRRNIALLTTPPAGSVSIEAEICHPIHGTTSGAEAAFKLSYRRRKKINPADQNARVDFVDQSGDCWEEFTVYHPAVKHWMAVTGETDITKSPWYGACANDLDWINAVKLQGRANRHVDHSISRTLNVPNDIKPETIGLILTTAWKEDCKGFTVYRDGCRSGVLVTEPTKPKKAEALKRPRDLKCPHYLSNF
jgi:ribonucleotide reductase alpha subunit/intein/homing endonuclease